ncbi:TPA: hypothetical protein ACIS09_001670 [Salmonella enterica subsp. enterica serovar Birkenhead]
MIPVELARTPELSRLKRKYHIAEAMYWRKAGNRQLKILSLHLSRLEKINRGELLDDNRMPF